MRALFEIPVMCNRTDFPRVFFIQGTTMSGSDDDKSNPKERDWCKTCQEHKFKYWYKLQGFTLTQGKTADQQQAFASLGKYNLTKSVWKGYKVVFAEIMTTIVIAFMVIESARITDLTDQVCTTRDICSCSKAMIPEVFIKPCLTQWNFEYWNSSVANISNITFVPSPNTGAPQKEHYMEHWCSDCVLTTTLSCPRLQGSDLAKSCCKRTEKVHTDFCYENWPE